MHSNTINWPSVFVALVALLAVTSYAYMVLHSTRHAVISTLVIGAASAFVAVVFGTIVLPYVTFQPRPSPGVRPYTTRELVGRAVYLREGCWYCHSQFVRLQDRDLGPVAEAGDYVFDSPHTMGTERTGPDLSNEGGKFPDEWHEIHISHPQDVRPGSIMPSFAWLMDRYPIDAAGNRFKYFDNKYQTWRDATDMDCLVLYIQSLGRRNAVTKERQTDVPWEYRFVLDPQKGYVKRIEPTAIPYHTRQIIQGEGMYNQFCSPCHGLDGRGEGYGGRDFWIPPANFTLPKYADYSEAKWFWRISEGIPGAQMPRWQFLLTPEQRWYLVRFLQYVNASANPRLHPPDDEWKIKDTKGRFVRWATPEELRRKDDLATFFMIDATTGQPKVDPKTGKPMVNPATGQPLPQPGTEGAPPLGVPLFTPAPAGDNPGGAPQQTLPVELFPAALTHPGAPSPPGTLPDISAPFPNVGMVPGGVATPAQPPAATPAASFGEIQGAAGTMAVTHRSQVPVPTHGPNGS